MGIWRRTELDYFVKEHFERDAFFNFSGLNKFKEDEENFSSDRFYERRNNCCQRTNGFFDLKKQKLHSRRN